MALATYLPSPILGFGAQTDQGRVRLYDGQKSALFCAPVLCAHHKAPALVTWTIFICIYANFACRHCVSDCPALLLWVWLCVVYHTQQACEPSHKSANARTSRARWSAADALEGLQCSASTQSGLRPSAGTCLQAAQAQQAGTGNRRGRGPRHRQA